LILISTGVIFFERLRLKAEAKEKMTKLMEMNPTTAKLIMPMERLETVAVEDFKKLEINYKCLNGDQVTY